MTAPAGRDRTTPYGLWALVGAVVCLPLGIIMIILSFQEARAHGRTPVLAWLATGLLVVFTIINIRLFTSGAAAEYLNR